MRENFQPEHDPSNPQAEQDNLTGRLTNDLAKTDQYLSQARFNSKLTSALVARERQTLVGLASSKLDDIRQIRDSINWYSIIKDLRGGSPSFTNLEIAFNVAAGDRLGLVKEADGPNGGRVAILDDRKAARRPVSNAIMYALSEYAKNG